MTSLNPRNIISKFILLLNYISHKTFSNKIYYLISNPIIQSLLKYKHTSLAIFIQALSLLSPKPVLEKIYLFDFLKVFYFQNALTLAELINCPPHT